MTHLSVETIGNLLAIKTFYMQECLRISPSTASTHHYWQSFFLLLTLIYTSLKSTVSMVWPEQTKWIQFHGGKYNPHEERTKLASLKFRPTVKKQIPIISVVISSDAVVFIFLFVAIPPCTVPLLRQWSWPTKAVTLRADAVYQGVSSHSNEHIKNKSYVMTYWLLFSYLCRCSVCLHSPLLLWRMLTLPP